MTLRDYLGFRLLPSQTEATSFSMDFDAKTITVYSGDGEVQAPEGWKIVTLPDERGEPMPPGALQDMVDLTIKFGA